MFASPYREIYPNTRKDQYNPSDPIVFSISEPGHQIRPDTIRLLGTRYFQKGGATVEATSNIFSEPAIGEHVLIDQISTTMKSGFVERLVEYPRLVKVITDQTVDPGAVDTESYYSVEGRCRNETVRAGYNAGRAAGDNGVPFCLRLEICVNKVYGEVKNANGLTQLQRVPLRYSDSGDININLILNTAANVFYGTGADATCNFLIKDLRLEYMVDAESPTQTPGLFLYGYNEQTFQMTGTQSSLECKTEGLTDGVHITFLPAADITDLTKNKYATPALPGIPIYGVNGTQIAPGFGAESVQYTIADQGSTLFAYAQQSREEILHGAGVSFGQVDSNTPSALWSASCYSLSRPGSPYGYCIGLAFGKVINLTATTFTVNISSQVKSASQWAAYMFLRQKIPLASLQMSKTAL